VAERPSDVDGGLSWFDRFADAVAKWTSKAWFFALCLGSVLLWAPSYLLIRDLDIYQLVINTFTTIVTFLLVALLQNTQKRADEAIQGKANAIAAFLLDPSEANRHELAHAVGLEDREGS
jgi:low affinity Fe/Cu permease